jgi:hypothetical protein
MSIMNQGAAPQIGIQQRTLMTQQQQSVIQKTQVMVQKHQLPETELDPVYH